MQRLVLALASAALGAVLAAGVAGAQAQSCLAVDSSTEEILPAVTATWDSSLLCAGAAPMGTYEFTVGVTNEAGSAEAITIETLELLHTTPRPGGQGPNATASAAGLPLALAAGERGTFTVSGNYELAETDEGANANLHLLASGTGASSGDPFALGINVHLRGEGAQEESGLARERGEMLELARRLAGAGHEIAALAVSGAAPEEVSSAARALDSSRDAEGAQDAESRGRPESPGPPANAGPPPWAGGPPPWAGRD